MDSRSTASKTRGRTSITKSPDTSGKSMSHRFTDNERKTQKTRGQDSGRGDRRDMSKTYSGNAKHAARGNTPRKDVKTRAR
jgi:hypothetical protein